MLFYKQKEADPKAIKLTHFWEDTCSSVAPREDSHMTWFTPNSYTYNFIEATFPPVLFFPFLTCF